MRFGKAMVAMWLPVIALGITFGVTLQGQPGAPPEAQAKKPVQDSPAFSKSVRPTLQEYCLPCHSGPNPAAKLNLQTLPADFQDPRTASQWKEVVNVLNQRQMPPKTAPQIPAARQKELLEAISQELALAEQAKRSSRVVLRRLNRAEYNNTVRDLLGVDLDPASKFPEDGSAGGFDNIGAALTLSPLQIELYYAAARELLDKALVEGPPPPQIKLHFEPEENTKGMDAYRVNQGPYRDIIVNDGENPTENGFTVMHHESWNKHVDFRNFNLPAEGEYIIRFRAASRIPTRAQVVESARGLLKARFDSAMRENPNGKQWHQEAFDNDLKHFQTHRMYDYGPARLKIVKHLGSAPSLVSELDIDASEAAPKVFEVRDRFTTQQTGVDLLYAYDVPGELENWWLQSNDRFARPQLLIDWIEIEGPVTPTWPPASHRRILFDSPLKATNELAYARDVLSRFMTRAFRRPVAAEEVEKRLARYREARTQGQSFVESIKLPLASILTSPNFLFLVEADREGGQLTDYEIATRLSYFLLSTMPDAELNLAAKEGKLHQPVELAKQVDRLLADRRSQQFVTNFVGQWLGLRKVGANPPVKNLYPEYDRHLETSIIAESEGFFSEILRKDLDARSLLKSDFVTINERLGRFYGIPGVRGDAIRKVPVPAGVKRGGLLTQASILSITSNGTRTSPVTRGVWVLRTLLGADPGLPVANVGEIPNKIPGIGVATVRKRLEAHRQNPSCARCHDKIDPLGLALENFNAAGEWRTQEGHGYNGRIEANDPVIDASATMPDGTRFAGVDGLQQQLLKNQDAFLENLGSQLMTYALGRELGFSDRPAVKAAVKETKSRGYTVRSLIHEIVASKPFQTK